MAEIIYIDDCLADRHLMLAAHHESRVTTPLRVFASGAAYFAYLDGLPDDDRQQRILLLDLNMPGQNGLDVLQVLQSRYLRHSTLVWMFSNSTRPAEHQKLKEAGAARFVSKPLEPDLTVVLIRELVQCLGERPQLQRPLRNHLLQILLIEDSNADAQLLMESLREAEQAPEVERVQTIAGAQTRLAEQHFDCVILDLNLPDAQELQGLLELTARWPKMPLVAITGQHRSGLGRAVVRAGAQSFFDKGNLGTETLLHAIEYAVERQGAVNELRDQLRHSRSEAMCDALTGLPNRRALEQRFEALYARKREPDAFVSALVVVDIDGLKEANDVYGHQMGDALIRQVADALQRSLRVGATLARVGGDEFVVLLANLPAGDWVELMVSRMRQVIAMLPPLADGAVIARASFGYALIPHEGAEFQAIFDLADAKMYADKVARRGGDRRERERRQ